MKLASSDPFAKPIIDPGLLKTTWDKVALRESIKAAEKFLSAPSFSGYVISRGGAYADATTDAKLDTYIANSAGTLFHPVGTAVMSPKGASTGVVDPDLRVKKVTGLRVVDVSILVCVSPHATIGHG